MEWAFIVTQQEEGKSSQAARDHREVGSDEKYSADWLGLMLCRIDMGVSQFKNRQPDR